MAAGYRLPVLFENPAASKFALRVTASSTPRAPAPGVGEPWRWRSSAQETPRCRGGQQGSPLRSTLVSITLRAPKKRWLPTEKIRPVRVPPSRRTSNGAVDEKSEAVACRRYSEHGVRRPLTSRIGRQPPLSLRRRGPGKNSVTSPAVPTAEVFESGSTERGFMEQRHLRGSLETG